MANGSKELTSTVKNVLGNASGLPFATSTEITTIRGYKSAKSVYNSLRTLETRDYITSVRYFPQNAAQLTKRFFISKKGTETLPGILNADLRSIMAYLPCTSRWQIELVRRIDALALYYGICLKIAESRPGVVPMEPFFPRPGSIDAYITCADGMNVGIMRKGNTLPFSEFRKRFWSITQRDGTVHLDNRVPPLTLVIVPSLYEKKWLAGRIAELYSRQMVCAIATEYEATELPIDAVTWRICEQTPQDMSFAEMIQNFIPDLRYKVPPRQPYKVNIPPVDCSKLSPPQLNPLHKKILTCLADWQLLKPEQMADILGIERSTRFRDHLSYLLENRMIEQEKNETTLVVADEGLRYLAYRDRTSVGKIRRSWGSSGTQMQKALIERSHSLGVNKLVSRIHAEHAGRIEALPSHAANRRYSIGMNEHRFINPDAALLLRLGGDLQSVLLEYERRASRGGKPLWRKLHVWMVYYLIKNRQYIGNVSQAENPHKLEDEVVLFVVSTDGIQGAILKRCHTFLIKEGWNVEQHGPIPVAVANEREIESANSILTDKIWLRLDDFQRRRTNPILSETRRASPRPRK